jgi:hypothetical protein
MSKTLGAQPTSTTNTLYIDSRCHDDGLLEQWIETTSEVVSILIGSAACYMKSRRLMVHRVVPKVF